MPPQELFITLTPLLVNCWFTDWKNCASAAVTVDGGVLPLSSGALSSMIRADTRSAPGAMPPGKLANGVPAAISDTHVPWPTTSSMLVLLVSGSTSMYSCRTRPATVGLPRMMPLSTNPMVTPWPVYPASCAAYVLVIDNCASIGGCGVVGVVAGGGALVGVLRMPPPPPPPQAAKANISSPGTVHRTFPGIRIIMSRGFMPIPQQVRRILHPCLPAGQTTVCGSAAFVP